MYAFTTAVISTLSQAFPSVGLAFEMLFAVPAVFLVSGTYGSSDGLMSSWINAVTKYPETELRDLADARKRPWWTNCWKSMRLQEMVKKRRRTTTRAASPGLMERLSVG